MKQHLRLMLASICWLMLLIVSALAQGPAELETKKKILAEKIAAEEMELQFRGEVYKVMGTKFGFETKVVKGAPYSATAEAETVQMLADGNRIRNKTTTTVYRDNEGRTRREITGKTSDVITQVFITDPVSGVNYALDPQRRAGVKSPAYEPSKLVLGKMLAEKQPPEGKPGPEGFKPPTAININGQPVPWEQLTEEERVKVETKLRAAKEMKPGAKEVPAGALKKKAGTEESLGQQMIEGVRCEGKRTTITIPANSIGNDLPINIVSEEWYSPELQVLVLTRQSDPRSGETTYRLLNINRSAPDRTLFEVPADYNVRDNSVLPKKKRLPEEEEQ